MKVDLKRLPKARLDFISPMLAKPTEQLPSGPDWVYEVKLDGYRTIVMKKRGRMTIFSRRGNVVNGRYPKMPASFDFLPDNTMVDGELVVLDAEGKPSFSALQHAAGSVTSLYFYAFDLLILDGKDLRKLRLTDRRILLEEHTLVGMTDPVRLSMSFTGSPMRLVTATKKAGLEGIIAKRVGSTYESGDRSAAWLKYKTNKGQELVIGGYKPSPLNFDYLLAGYYEGRDLIFIAKIKNGFTPGLRRKVAEHFSGLKTTRCPFANLPEAANARRGEAITAEVMTKIQWLKPRLVAQIEFTEWTKGNHLRHSRFIGLRDDKEPTEVIKEVI
jgi:DNA ligase D-like protein (predicted ligase)